MTKHIVDGPRIRGGGHRLKKFSHLDSETAQDGAPQSKALQREPRTRDANEKVKRFTEIQRRTT